MGIYQKLLKYLEKFEILSVNSVSRFTFHRFEGFFGHHRRCCGRPQWGFCPEGGGEGSGGRTGAMAAGGGWATGKTEKLQFSVQASVFCSFRRESGDPPGVVGTVGFVWMLAVQWWSELHRRRSVEGDSKERRSKG